MQRKLGHLPPTGEPSPSELDASVLELDEDSQSRVRAPMHLSEQDRLRFHALYCDHFDFVYRNLRRLGVAAESIDDALQDVYVVVLRRWKSLVAQTHVKAWLFAILLRVASNHRRSQRRKLVPEPLQEERHEAPQPGPFEAVARAQAGAILHTFLSGLDEGRRAAFVMAELEQMTVPEIAGVLSANVNTVYSWLRNTRQQLVQMLEASKEPGSDPYG